jgi:hypothetical protein
MWKSASGNSAGYKPGLDLPNYPNEGYAGFVKGGTYPNIPLAIKNKEICHLRHYRDAHELKSLIEANSNMADPKAIAKLKEKVKELLSNK